MPDVAALPTGTVTLLFTDVEGSTRLWERHPAQMRAALAAHDALIEVLTARHGGHAMNEMSFRIAGLTNPTLQVPLGAHVVVRFINGDSRLPHGWAVIDAGSLSDQPLRSRRPALPGAVAMLFDKASGSQWPGQAITFSADEPGHYVYLCQVGDPARMGMLGHFDVVDEGLG